jgi:hypothetical protein
MGYFNACRSVDDVLSEESSKLWLWPCLAWCLGVLGMVGLWLGVTVWLDSACLWMSIFAVLDIALMLQLTGIKAGWPRFIGISLGAILIVIASQWLIAANAFGLVMGLWPLEAALQIGQVLAWEFTRLRAMQMDLIYLPLSAFLAWFFGLRGSK